MAPLPQQDPGSQHQRRDIARLQRRRLGEELERLVGVLFLVQRQRAGLHELRRAGGGLAPQLELAARDAQRAVAVSEPQHGATDRLQHPGALPAEVRRGVEMRDHPLQPCPAELGETRGLDRISAARSGCSSATAVASLR